MFASGGSRSSQNGRHDNANERREDFVHRQNCPTQAKTGLEWGTRPIHSSSSDQYQLVGLQAVIVCSPMAATRGFTAP